jgi:putative nucleotidyltransferase with HDIG domain
MFAWIQRLFSKSPSPPQAARAAASREGAPPGEPPSATDGAPPSEPEPKAKPERQDQKKEPFELSSIAEYTPDQVEKPTPEDHARLEPTAAMVFDHFHANLKNLPALPQYAGRIFAMVEKPDVDVQELTRLIAQDSMISGQVLKAANSVYYSRGIDIESVRDAVVRLGLKEVKDVAAAASTIALFDVGERASHEEFAEFWQQLWHHSMTTAFGAGWLAMELRKGKVDRAFLGGMFHDIGKTAALRSLSALILNGTVEPPVSAAFIELVLERAHVAMGKELSEIWQLPSFVHSICATHHEEALAADVDHVEHHIVRVVSGINEIRSNPRHKDTVLSEVHHSNAALGIDQFRLRAVARQIKDFSAKAVVFN